MAVRFTWRPTGTRPTRHQPRCAKSAPSLPARPDATPERFRSQLTITDALVPTAWLLSGGWPLWHRAARSHQQRTPKFP